MVTAAAVAIGGGIALSTEERDAVTSSEIESLPSSMLTASWVASALVVAVFAGWYALVGAGLVRRRRWARLGGVATFAVGAVLALVVAVDIEPEKAEGPADPVEGAGAPAYAVAVLNAAGAVVLLLPAVRADFTDAWLDRLGPERRAATEARRNYRW